MQIIGMDQIVEGLILKRFDGLGGKKETIIFFPLNELEIRITVVNVTSNQIWRWFLAFAGYSRLQQAQ